MSRAGWWVILRREMGAYFNSPIAYIFLFVFLALTGSLFMSQVFLVGLADLRAFFNLLPIILCVFLPAVTMRLWADEKRGNTFELLLTFPMRPHDLVAGKFLASLLFYLAALAATLPMPLMLSMIGKPDAGQILGGYVGAALLGALFLAIGIFVSGLCRDQIVAFIVAMLSCVLVYLLGTDFIAASIDGWLPGFGSALRDYVGVTRHFVSAQKGVLDLRDVLYFTVGTALFLALNGFWIEGRLRPKQTRLFAVASTLAAAIFVLSNWLFGDLALLRVDLTEGQSYTISPVTRRLLRELKAPATVKYYVSPLEKMPTNFKTLEREVLDKLDEFRLASQGKLQYKVFHLEAANVTGGEGREESLEASLQQKGVHPFQVQSIEADEMGVRLVYSAMTIAYKEKPEETVPEILPAMLHELEYTLMSRLHRMTLSAAPKIAVVAPHQETPIEPALRDLLRQLGQTPPESRVEDRYRLIPLALEHEGYQTARVALTEQDPIPSGTRTLVILEPTKFTEEQRVAVNRFLVEGGSVFLALQQYEFQYTPSGRGELDVVPERQEHEMGSLLQAWGLGVDERALLDANQEMISVTGRMRMGPFEMSVPVKLPIHIRVDQDGMNQGLSITSRLSTLLYLWGSALRVDEKQLASLGLTARVLLRSSAGSWVSSLSDGRLTQRALQPTAAEARGPFPLAVLVEGQFPNAFEQTKPDVKLSPAPGKLLLMGAYTPFQEQLLEKGGHLNLFLNGVDALTLSEDLIMIRAKEPFDRSITRLSTAAKGWWRLVISLAVPILVACVGWMRILMRRRVKVQYLRLVQVAA